MTNTFLGNLVEDLAEIFEPLKEAVNDQDKFIGLMRELGWEVTNVPSSYSNLSTAIDSVITLYSNTSSSSTESQVLEVLAAIKDVYLAIKALSTAPTGIDSSQISIFLQELPERLTELLIVKYLTQKKASVVSLFEFLSIIEITNNAATIYRPAYIRRKLNFGKLVDLIKNPIDLEGSLDLGQVYSVVCLARQDCRAD